MLPSTHFHWSEIISHANVCFPCKQISDMRLNKYLFPCQQIFVALYRRTFHYQLSWSTAPNQIAFQQVSSTPPILIPATKQEFFFSRNLFGNQTVVFTLEVKLIAIFTRFAFKALVGWVGVLDGVWSLNPPCLLFLPHRNSGWPLGSNPGTGYFILLLTAATFLHSFAEHFWKPIYLMR